MSNLNSWVGDANIRLRDGRVWGVDGFRVVRDLLQVSVRSDDVLLLAGDCWCDDGRSVVVGDPCIADSDGSQETHKLRSENKLFSDIEAGEFRESSSTGLGSMNFKLASPPRKKVRPHSMERF